MSALSIDRRAGVLVLIGALVGVAFWWFTQNYGFGKERAWVGYSGEARVNRFYAARLLLEKLDAKVHQQADLRHLDSVPRNAVMLLAATRDELDPVAVEHLIEWVEGGGHLIAGADFSFYDDPLLEALGVAAEYDDEDEEEEEDNGDAPPGPSVDTVELPDGTRVRVDLLPSPMLFDEEDGASWRHTFAGGVRVLELPWGEGRITLLATLRPFANQNIGQFDHAELLAHLVGGAKEVWLIRWIESPSLPAWLWEHAPGVVAMLVLFLLLALWRLAPRFGPLAPSPEPDRRSLLEHIHAVGRFASDQGELQPMLAAVRQDCQDQFARAAPQAQGLDAAARLREAARLTRMRPRDLLQAFTHTPANRHEFTIVVRTLASFRRRLARRLS